MINISIYLYGKPSWELDIEGKNNFKPSMFKKHGENLRARMYEVAETLEKMESGGWDLKECHGTLYSLDICKKGFSKSEIKKELKKMGIDPNSVGIEEFKDE